MLPQPQLCFAPLYVQLGHRLLERLAWIAAICSGRVILFHRRLCAFYCLLHSALIDRATIPAPCP